MTWEQAAARIERTLIIAGIASGSDRGDMVQSILCDGLKRGLTPEATVGRAIVRKIGPGANRIRLRRLAGIADGPTSHRSAEEHQAMVERMSRYRRGIERTRTAPPLSEEQIDTLAKRYGITPEEVDQYRREDR